MKNRIRIEENQVIINSLPLEEKIKTKSINHILFDLEEDEKYIQLEISNKESLKGILDCQMSDLTNIADFITFWHLDIFEEFSDATNISLPFEIKNRFTLSQKTLAPISYKSGEKGFRRIYDYLREGVDDSGMISVGIDFDWSSWKNPYYSPIEFQEAFLSTYPNIRSEFFFASYTSTYYREHDSFENLNLSLKSPAYQHSLREIISEFLKHIRVSYELAVKSLLSQADTESLIEYFSFPEESKTACIQYLQYFYEFLKDIGVQAKVKVDLQDSGGTILSVIPEDKEEALENIRLALDVYLRLPSTQIETGMSSISVQSLNAQIFHLKGQLVLAAATIQQQQSTIQNLQI